MSGLGVVVPVDAPVGLIAVGTVVLVVLGGAFHLFRSRRAHEELPTLEDGATDSPSLAHERPREEARLRVQGDLHVRGRSVLPGAVEVCGSLLLDADAQLDAQAEVQGDASLGERARSVHPLVVHGNLTLGRDAEIPGCTVEGDVILGPGARVTGAIRCRALYLDEEEPSARNAYPPREEVAEAAVGPAEVP